MQTEEAPKTAPAGVWIAHLGGRIVALSTCREAVQEIAERTPGAEVVWVEDEQAK